MSETTAVALDTVPATVTPLGWQFQANVLVTAVAVGSLVDACRVAEIAAGACGADAEGLLRVDVRADAAHLTVGTRTPMTVTRLELDLVRDVAAALSAAGYRCGAAGAQDAGQTCPVPVLELAVDALDIAAVRPFWKALLGYADHSTGDPGAALVDPAGRLPQLWFQQMDAPRPQRNRIHLDVWVPADEARSRLDAVLAAGGVLVTETPSFWTVADVEGNEACICWWPSQGPASP